MAQISAKTVNSGADITGGNRYKAEIDPANSNGCNSRQLLPVARWCFGSNATHQPAFASALRMKAFGMVTPRRTGYRRSKT